MELQNPFSQSRASFTIFFGLLLFLLLLLFMSRRRRTRTTATRKAPPEASGAWPLIGHLHLLRGSQPPHVTLGNMADKYGPIFTLRLGVHKTLVVSNWEMAKQCFTVNDKVFASRPKSLAFEVLGYNFSIIGFSPYGSYWRQVLLTLVDKGEEFDGYDANTTIKATCLALILAGTDTTTGTLIWALSLLLNNTKILNRAIHELDTQIGKRKMVEVSDLKKLESIQSIIKETLRLYPAGPLNIPHESMEDCIVGGYHVPTGTHLLTNISKLQRDPLLYPDPLKFLPERFLTTHKDVDIKGQHFELIPFGAGRRMCPGISFSLQIMQLTLATLLHGFDIVTCDGRPIDMLEQIGLTNIKASPLETILTPRLSPHIYDEI